MEAICSGCRKEVMNLEENRKNEGTRKAGRKAGERGGNNPLDFRINTLGGGGGEWGGNPNLWD